MICKGKMAHNKALVLCISDKQFKCARQNSIYPLKYIALPQFLFNQPHYILLFAHADNIIITIKAIQLRDLYMANMNRFAGP